MSLEKIYSTRAEICRDSFDSLTLLIDCFRATIVIRELIDWFHFTSIDLGEIRMKSKTMLSRKSLPAVNLLVASKQQVLRQPFRR